jgi:hypothetical protein
VPAVKKSKVCIQTQVLRRPEILRSHLKDFKSCAFEIAPEFLLGVPIFRKDVRYPSAPAIPMDHFPQVVEEKPSDRVV